MKPLVIYHAQCADGFGAADMYLYTVEDETENVYWVGIGKGRRAKESLRLRQKQVDTQLIVKIWFDGLSYEKARELEKKIIAECRANNHPLLNKSPYASALPGEMNPMKSASTAKKISEAQTANNSFKDKTHSDETKARWKLERIGAKASMYGKHHSEETRTVLSLKAKQRVRKVCPHCLKDFTPGNYAKYHGENCKHA